MLSAFIAENSAIEEENTSAYRQEHDELENSKNALRRSTRLQKKHVSDDDADESSNVNTSDVIVDISPRKEHAGDPDEDEEANQPHFQLYNVFVQGGKGVAVKLVLEEWLQEWSKANRSSDCQLLNFVLLLSDIAGPYLKMTDLDSADPAGILASLQRRWTLRALSERSHYQLLSPRNRSRLARTVREGYREWWSRWAKIPSSMDDGASNADDFAESVLTWLLTMSTSGYRVLRHAATIGCLAILTGTAQEASHLTRQLDRANRNKGDSFSTVIDGLGGRVAALEKTMQMIFDAVFVQRFRDVETDIREETVSSLTTWIESYPEVFLENSYLRYLGWALSDRASSVREAALTGISALVRVGQLRTGMGAFLQRFRPRIGEMAARDVEEGVREKATQLWALLLRYTLGTRGEGDEEEVEEMREASSFLLDRIITRQALDKHTLLALSELVFGEAEIDPLRPVKQLENDGLLLAVQLASFLSDLVADIPFDNDSSNLKDVNEGSSSQEQNRQALQIHQMQQCIVEHFVEEAKREWPFLRDPALWIGIVDVALSPDKEAQRPHELASPVIMEMCLRVTLPVVRQSSAKTNKFSSSTSSLESSSIFLSVLTPSQAHSRDWALSLNGKVVTWIEGLGRLSGFSLAPFYDLLELADASVLFSQAHDQGEKLTSTVAALSANNATLADHIAWVRLLAHWRYSLSSQDHENLNTRSNEDALGIINELIMQLVDEDVKELEKWAHQSISNINWARLIGECPWWWARLPAWMANHHQISSSLSIDQQQNIVSSLTTLLHMLITALSADYGLVEDGDLRQQLESIVMPSLLCALVIANHSAGYLLLNEAHLYSNLVSGTTLGIMAVDLLQEELAKDDGLPPLNTEAEAALIALLTRNLNYRESIRAIFGLAKLSVDSLLLSGNVLKTAFCLLFPLLGDDSTGFKCFTILWRRACSRKDTQEINLTIACQILAEVSPVDSVARLSKLLAEPFKSLSSARNSEALVAFHVNLLNALRQKETMVVESINARLTPFAPLLSHNLAAEQLATVRKTCPQARDYIKALERAAGMAAIGMGPENRRPVGRPRRPLANVDSHAGSRLREQVSSLAGSEAESPSEDGRINSKDHPASLQVPTAKATSAPPMNQMDDVEMKYIDESATPIKEMEGLHMSSDVNLPSSPLQSRKRVIRL